MRTCPICALASPDSAIVCDCGHAFDVVAAAKIESVAFTPARDRHREPLGGGAKVLLTIGGWVLGGGLFAGITGAVDDPSAKSLGRLAPMVGTACAALLLELAAAPRTSVPPKGNYFVRHWRGELSLRLSYWVNVPFASILGLVMVRAIVGLVVTAVGLGDAYRKLFLLGGLWLAMSAVLAWGAVGIWRSAGRPRPGADGRSEISPWGPLARVVVVLAGISFAFAFGFAGQAALQVALEEARRN
jgi:hypothetical protein